METTRQTLAAALKTVEGVTGYDKRPKPIKPKDAWSRIDQMTHGPGQAWQTQWRIILVVGPDEATAMDQFDELVPQVVDALQALAYVDLARAVQIPAEQGNNLFGIEFIARSE